MADEIQWWGVATCRSLWPREERRKRLKYLAATAKSTGVLVTVDDSDDGAPRSLTLRWSAPDDLNAAVRRIFEISGTHASDFERGPERVS